MANQGIYHTAPKPSEHGHRLPFKLDEIWAILRDFGHVAGVIVGLWALGLQIFLAGGIDMANLRDAASVSFNAEAELAPAVAPAPSAIDVVCATPEIAVIEHATADCGETAGLPARVSIEEQRRDTVRKLLLGPQN
ncbi:hypothetical protein ACQ5SP_14735 [Rhodovulum sp. YNF3179]|uniref:hypothetical protein n=1 Tax=Rhodovulum sp. YNF3179 TaxID=3425127 RepID=UPI003D342B74